MRKGDVARKRILSIIAEYHSEHGYMPSVREICELANINSTSTIQNHMEILFAKGCLDTDAAPGTARAYRLTDKGRSLNID